MLWIYISIHYPIMLKLEPVSVVGASLKKPCTPNEIYTFGIMHKSFLQVLLLMKLDDAKLECGGVFVQMASKLARSRSL